MATEELPKMTKSQVELCVLICLVYVSWGLTDSIQAPFYPIEAEEKGATASEYGLVFGIIHLAMFISSPLFGHFLPKLGLRRVFSFGVLTTAACACLFGLLDYLPTKWSFLGASYGLRIVEGVAEAGAWASVLTMLSDVYGKNVTWVYSLTQASFGFAEILGPSLGGIMFEAGGFLLPFEVSGLLCLLVGGITLYRLPALLSAPPPPAHSLPPPSTFSASSPLLQTQYTTRPDSYARVGPSRTHSFASLPPLPLTPSSSPSSSSSSSFVKMLASPHLVLALTGTMLGAVCQGFIESFLEEYLALFGLTVTQIGVSFLAMSIPYMLATPVFGWLASSLSPSLISPVGNILIFCSLLLVGPPTYLPLAPSLLLTELGLALLGVGTAATLTATFAMAQKHGLQALGDSCSLEEAHSTISGLWTAAFALGSFLGPTVGGPLVIALGFSGTTPIIQVWAAIMLALDVLVISLAFTKSSKNTKSSKSSQYSSF